MTDDLKIHRVAPGALVRAHRLRHEQTPPEVTLWSKLRGRELGGFKFRRQCPIGPFVADFCCAACKLVVELDGDSHAEQQARDAARSDWLRGRGYQVLRFTNHDLGRGIEGVLETILAECERLAQVEGRHRDGVGNATKDVGVPSPQPSP